MEKRFIKNWKMPATKKVKLIVIDDDTAFHEQLSGHLDPEEFEVRNCTSGEEAVEAAGETEIDVGIINIGAAGINGMELFKQIREIQPNFEAIILTTADAVDRAIDAIKLGVYSYITKPCKMFELELLIRKAYEKKALAMENLRLKSRLTLDKRDYTIVGESGRIENFRKLVEKVGHSTTPVLIRGEAGSGKEFTAMAMHTQSFSKEAPFITVDCGLLPHDTVENRLFGPGGDDAASISGNGGGWLEMADGGTLFLANVGELQASTQLKLYRFLETGELQRDGSNRAIRVSVRIIASTRHNLREMVTDNKFREDLFYRLSVITIDVPSLRERKEDIPHLIDQFMEENRQLAHGKTFSKKAVNAILKYDWPGNIRELRNVVERTLLLVPKQVVQAKDIPITVEKRSKNNRLRHLMSLNEIEKEHILFVLNAAGGNISRASRILGVSRPKLYRKIEEYRTGHG